MVPVLLIVHTLNKWITSCKTYEQLTTCERMATKLLTEPCHAYTGIQAERHRKGIAKALQLKRLDLQMMPSLKAEYIAAELGVGRARIQH